MKTSEQILLYIETMKKVNDRIAEEKFDGNPIWKECFFSQEYRATFSQGVHRRT